jgi:prophage DNA circulation protein
VTTRSAVLFLGGRSGVGKSSVAYEIHAQLSASGVRHCLIEGDNLDMAWPPPWEQNLAAQNLAAQNLAAQNLAAQNLAAMCANYRALGYHRTIYTNTTSVQFVDELTTAMGDNPEVTAVLLTANDATARQRLAKREIGTALAQHIERSDKAARRLDQQSPAWVHRIPTDNREVAAIAAQIITLIGWPAGS